jgi:hypothetical protein
LTNRHLDLVPRVKGISNVLGMLALWSYGAGDEPVVNASIWVLLTRSPPYLDADRPKNAATAIEPKRNGNLWTYDCNNFVEAMQRGRVA